jgi:hypothetical protein
MRGVAEEKIPEDPGIAKIDAKQTDGMNSISAIVWFSLATAAMLILGYLRAS